MTAEIESTSSLRPRRAVEPHIRGRYQAPFALRCGAWLIDYVLIALPVSLSTFIARLMGGGARIAGGTSERVGIIITIILAVLDLGILAGIRGQTVGKWTTGLRIERVDGHGLGIGHAFLRHFVGYPISFFLFGLGFLIVVVSPGGRALHDFIAGTVVVRDYTMVPKNRPKGARAPDVRT